MLEWELGIANFIESDFAWNTKNPRPEAVTDKAVARMANKAGSAVRYYWSTQRMRKMWVALVFTARKMVPEGAARAYWWMAGVCLSCCHDILR